MNKIRVMIVEDSPTMRVYLEHIIGADPRLTVAAAYASAEEAIANLARVAPDVISLDIRLPRMNGLDATLRIMSERPTPIVVIAADVDEDQLNISMNALRAGALVVVAKPSGDLGKNTELGAKICDQLVSMSVVKLVRQRTARLLPGSPTPQPSSTALPSAAYAHNINYNNNNYNNNSVPLSPAAAAAPRFPAANGRARILGVVASTGGPNAVVNVLGKLPANFPLPILLVQHITPSFLASFVGWLAGLCPFKVQVAKDGEIPMRGHVYVPPVDMHLEIATGRLTLTHGPEVCSQRPSGSVLFHSMAKTFGPAALGVLLTGMGEDGAVGLQAIKQAGGHTIAEHESTCVVYGMPGAAVRLGAATEVRPVDEIAARLTTLAEGA